MYSLTSAVTFTELQDIVQEKFQIAPDRQKLRYGFPPKELSQPEGEEVNNPLPLHHGDKIMIEILPENISIEVAGEGRVATESTDESSTDVFEVAEASEGRELSDAGE